MQYLAYLALFATAVLAVPLNINLGAYSPALVVGDGEISFGGAEAETAATPAAGAAAGGAAKEGAGKEATTINPPAEGNTAAQLAALGSVTSTATGMGKNINAAGAPLPHPLATFAVPEKRSITKRSKAIEKRQNFAAALSYATSALKSGPEVQLGTGKGGSGVGITQKAGGAAPAAGKAARDLDEEKRSGPTVTLLNIRTLPASS